MNLPGRRVQATLLALLGCVSLILIALTEGDTLIAIGWTIVAVSLFLGFWLERIHSKSSDNPLV